MTPLTPDAVMTEIAAALPQDCKANVIIIGSLAAGYHFFSGDAQRSIRTKDVDCMLSPHAKAVAATERVTQRLLDAHWKPKQEGDWSEPGNEHTPDNKLPLIRLTPPGSRAGADWFLEFLGAPTQDSEQAKTFHRVQTRRGHFAICSFRYLALAEYKPLETKVGLRVARPEMMALANMLHHPKIGPDLITNTTTKRSNKDLGRVLALAWLTLERDRRNGTEEFDAWPDRMADALRTCFPGRAGLLAQEAGSGLRDLLRSPGDLNEALSLCNKGLLASMEIDNRVFEATGRRFMQQVVEPLAAAAFD